MLWGGEASGYVARRAAVQCAGPGSGLGLSVGRGRFGEELQSGVGRELGTDGGGALLQRDDTEQGAGEEVCFLDLY